jgi:hypothetical protein
MLIKLNNTIILKIHKISEQSKGYFLFALFSETTILADGTFTVECIFVTS